jgi:hypothetical protein
MLRKILWVLAACGLTTMAFSDTVYFRSASGEEKLVAKDVLITNTTSWSENRGLAHVSYYFWHPRNLILTKHTVSTVTGESCRVEMSAPEERQRILSSFFESGIGGAVTDIGGIVHRLFCLRSHYVLRGVRYVGSTDPEDDTLLSIDPGGTAQVNKLSFSDLARVEFTGKKAISVIRNDGKMIKGEFYDFNYDTFLMGLDQQGKEVSIPFSDVMKIEFAPKASGK